MNPNEQGFLLLTCHMGDPDRKVLTVAQFRELAKRAALMERPLLDRELTILDLEDIGCRRDFAQRVIGLLSQAQELAWYLNKAGKCDCVPITRVHDAYPGRLRKCLGLDAPAGLWAKGNMQILDRPAIALVGSRDLSANNREFAKEVGKQAALQGYVLVSGNARGADRTAQESCLANGGQVISIVADRLDRQPLTQNILYLSEEGFDMPFSPQRALSRNRVIHALGQKVFVAQAGYRRGGTWQGTVKNLQNNWSPVFCYADHTPATAELLQMGAVAVDMSQLAGINQLTANLIQMF